MSFLFKTRTGKLTALQQGRRFLWEIPNISTYSVGTTLDSDLETHHQGARFHFHLSFSTNGDIGFYIHFKSPPIPKYSYYLRNCKGEIMRQQTAHTIPDSTERCGHWNVCSRPDLLSFIQGGPNTLFIVMSFDDDEVSMLDGTGQPPKIVLDSLGISGQQNGVSLTQSPSPQIPQTTQILWKIPDFTEKCLWPYTSEGFFIGNTNLVCRLDIRRRSTTTCVASYSYDDIDSLIVFLFSRSGEIPSYAIEFVYGPTGKDESFAGVAPQPPGMAQALMVNRDVLDNPTVRQKCKNTLYILFTLIMRENPLDYLNQQGVPSKAPVKIKGKKLHRLKKGTKEAPSNYTVMEES